MTTAARPAKDIYCLSPEGYLEFSPAFFQGCMREYLQDPGLTVTAAQYLGEVGVTATTRMKYAGEKDKLVGLFHYAVEYTAGGQSRRVEMLVKSKTHYLELCERLAGVLLNSGIKIENLAARLAETELYNTHMKEIEVFRMQRSDPAFRKILPAVYGSYVDDASRQYMVLEEFLAGAYVMKDYTDITYWTPAVTRKALLDMVEMHAAYYGRAEALRGLQWLGAEMNAARMQSLAPLWRAYAEKMRYFTGKLFDAQYLDLHFRWIDTIPEWWGRNDRQKKTLIFNDAQIRNLAVRDPQTKPQLVLFDWECTSIQLPQRDLVELLSYCLDERTSDAEILSTLEAARAHLAECSGQKIDPQDWRQGCIDSIRDFHINRMACQLVLHITLNRPDIERVFRASMRILRSLEQNA
ncbi:MAG TPA: phosphotransferase [Terriglobales bacterium]|nr:phosphotransferase [Terriglobales bacterium]